ncbi:hypothetical protein H2202_003859 [Exophiala xenobiotica]|nr:hypothetical protein H2202_003859 [Exophiala xenobiotica]KAK5196948.1 hypothetical protein LTR92_002886 [Exophiala xenobiotica]KAK5238064.1 hypothetical protein LTR47_001157 [Exophiala xenobiotica]KAK5252019.1 hypothetical protein LTS06_003319 [Exophiala xenobiotica]KAK5261244.1 hypothetical protein LTR40_002613 [Exophiala xenobiotica]
MPQAFHLLKAKPLPNTTTIPAPVQDQYDFDELHLPGVELRLLFEAVSPSHMKLTIKEVDNVDSLKPSSAVIKFPAKACGDINIEKVDTAWYGRVTDNEQASSGEHFLALSTFDLDHVCAEGLFIEDCPAAFLPLQEYLNTEKHLAIVFDLTTKRLVFDYARPKFVAEKAAACLSPWAELYERLPVLPDTPPRLSIASQRAFLSWDEYKHTFAIGMEYERRLDEGENDKGYKCDVRIIEMPDTKNRKYQMIISCKRKIDLAPGDKAHLWFDDDSDEDLDRSKIWDVTILPPVPYQPSKWLTATLTRRRNPETHRYCDDRNLVAIQRSAIPSGSAGRDFVLDQKSVEALIQPDKIESTFKRNREALEVLNDRFNLPDLQGMDKALLDFLLARHPSKITKFDMYATLAETSADPEASLNLNESQKAAVRLGRDAAAGFLVCHGGPGTGKTHFVVEAVQPFLKDRGRKHRLLLTSAGNAGADALALAVDCRLNNLISEKVADPHGYVLRVHCVTTEKDIFLSAADIRAQALIDHVQSGQSEKSSFGLDESDEQLFDHFVQYKEDFLQDARAQHIELSVGHKMLQMAGIIPGATTDTSEWTALKEMYRRYSRHEIGRSDKDFQKEIENLFAHVISSATSVCCTATGAGNPKVSGPYADAELLVVDEAARVVEYELWPLLAFYQNLVGKILVGDIDQLPPVLKSTGIDAGKAKNPRSRVKPNPFVAQLELSFQERIQAAGFNAAFFQVQHRAVPQIAAVFNNVIYDGRLLNHESTHVDHRALAQKVVQHNESIFKYASPVVFVDLPDAEEELRPGSHSKHNSAYANAALIIVEDLLIAGFGTTEPCTIAILMPYNAEYEYLQYAKGWMCEQYPQAADVVVDKIDKRQGAEFDIVIVDPCAVLKVGFLQKQRLNVLFSRARCGLYVLGNHMQWSLMYGDRQAWFKKFHEQLKEHRTEWPKEKSLESRFYEA